MLCAGFHQKLGVVDSIRQRRLPVLARLSCRRTGELEVLLRVELVLEGEEASSAARALEEMPLAAARVC
jgi:hypothetical protein